ncbi:methionyl-tRNA formyltransferase [Salinibacter ruber]|uniref:methionyl-tRNA formyltransferase n=1 Tax=Salinibacter ruber TaxID=146919 RepID=UPI002167C1C9|nr:formyltransferase family protein [Salinibacter ruber]MCS3935211.1 methionyl-tRNA formyltransferase [Salinibacter ruber]MCS4043246.1 methionyl-tRNA formyltransferase [Salinibacter ruber]
MNLFLLTQPDAFYIPKLLDRFMAEKPGSVQVVGAAVLKGEIAFENVADYLHLMGVRGTVINGLDFVRHKTLDVLDRAIGLDGLYSVQGALRAHGIPEHTPENVNDPRFLDFLREQNVDLVVSIACPQIVREDLLSCPPEGVINIHGALLPKYRGKLPSFWVLANGEEKTGVTVHYMNEDLDDGPIIVQNEIPIRPDDTLHSLVLRSKVQYGASALAEAVQQIESGTVETLANPEKEATYFSFPDEEAIRQFRERERKIR